VELRAFGIVMMTSMDEMRMLEVKIHAISVVLVLLEERLLLV